VIQPVPALARPSGPGLAPPPPGFGQAEREPFALARSSGFVVRAFRERSPKFRWHHHPEVELTFVASGSGVRCAGDAVLPFADGDLCLIRGGVPHGYSWSPRWRPARWIVLQLDPAAWGADFWKLPVLSGLSDLLSGTRAATAIHGSAAEEIAPRLKRLTRAATLATSGLGIVVEILEILASGDDQIPFGTSRHGADARIRPSASERRLERLLRALEQNSAAPLPRDAVAESLEMSPAAFSRWFRQRTGRTFQRHRTELRIGHACEMLATTRRTVTEIAFECGFGNLANFNRRFREIVQTTPKRYREVASAGRSGKGALA
jgi:AraC-like DNA-binding protein